MTHLRFLLLPSTETNFKKGKRALIPSTRRFQIIQQVVVKFLEWSRKLKIDISKKEEMVTKNLL